MSNIHLLSENITNKIAAGEVVQRPAAAVKELVENAIDAGASTVQVFVEDGGKKLIQVIDDGSGMIDEDLQMAFKRHATSKLATEDDLNAISTLGFRGEALASIAAVARVNAKSRSVDSEVGYAIQIHGGEIDEIEPTGMNVGTQIAVRDLFYNTPARRKFLKGRRSEFRQISETIKRFALGYPDLHIELYHDDKEVYLLQPSSLEERIGAIFSPTYVKKIIEIDEIYQGLGIFGYIGNLDLVRRSRGEQFLFLNNRYISDSLMNTAVYKGYQNMIERGEYPFFVLNLEVNPENVDVNVHPAKMEVKFRDQWHVYNTIRSAVERSFQDVLHMAGHFDREADSDIASQQSPAEQSDWTDTIRPQEAPKYDPQSPEPSQSRIPRFQPGQSRRTIEPPTEEETEGEADLQTRVDRFTQRQQTQQDSISERVWQVHKLYILSQIKSGLVIIDQHAAHERILFEEAMQAFESQSVAGQQLLFPQVVEFTPEDYDLMIDLVPYLDKIGFELKEFGKNTVVINATPSDLRGGDEAKLLRDILDDYKERRDKDNPAHYQLAATYSCKAAIKAGDPLSEDEMRTLIHQLFQCEHPYHCPHGRPVIVNLTLDELHKRFERPVKQPKR